MSSIREIKTTLRKEVLAKLKTYKEEERGKKSSKIAKKLFLSREFLRAKTIMFYLSFDGEVDTFTMIKQAIKKGKQVAVPVILRGRRQMYASLIQDVQSQTKKGAYGVMEPKKEHIRKVSADSLDLVIVPGVAFDRAGNRLGRGMGYYDRFLERLPKDVPTIGLAYDFQIIKDFPPLEPHDFSVTKVLFA